MSLHNLMTTPILIAVCHYDFGAFYFLGFVAHWNGYEVRDFAEQSRVYSGCYDIFALRSAGISNLLCICQNHLSIKPNTQIR
nr:hypothetical protein [uncultured Flavobacterium sp.]